MKKFMFLGALALMAVSATAQISLNQKGHVIVRDSHPGNPNGAVNQNQMLVVDTTAVMTVEGPGSQD